MEGWVDLGYSAIHRPGVKHATSRSQVRSPTTTPPSHPSQLSFSFGGFAPNTPTGGLPLDPQGDFRTRTLQCAHATPNHGTLRILSQSTASKQEPAGNSCRHRKQRYFHEAIIKPHWWYLQLAVVSLHVDSRHWLTVSISRDTFLSTAAQPFCCYCTTVFAELSLARFPVQPTYVKDRGGSVIVITQVSWFVCSFIGSLRSFVYSQKLRSEIFIKFGINVQRL